MVHIVCRTTTLSCRRCLSKGPTVLQQTRHSSTTTPIPQLQDSGRSKAVLRVDRQIGCEVVTVLHKATCSLPLRVTGQVRLALSTTSCVTLIARQYARCSGRPCARADTRTIGVCARRRRWPRVWGITYVLSSELAGWKLSSRWIGIWRLHGAGRGLSLGRRNVTHCRTPAHVSASYERPKRLDCARSAKSIVPRWKFQR